MRLAYVQHPFPAQGQTTDTAHLIVAEHATREGSYVALTRARETAPTSTPTTPPDADEPAERLAAMLAEHMSRTEPDIPSIDTPLAHERRSPTRRGQHARRRGQRTRSRVATAGPRDGSERQRSRPAYISPRSDPDRPPPAPTGQLGEEQRRNRELPPPLRDRGR